MIGKSLANAVSINGLLKTDMYWEDKKIKKVMLSILLLLLDDKSEVGVIIRKNKEACQLPTRLGRLVNRGR